MVVSRDQLSHSQKVGEQSGLTCIRILGPSEKPVVA